VNASGTPEPGPRGARADGTSSDVVDVAIVGGGPGGSTLGSLLRKYKRDLSVRILEKEAFPRDHVGESQLPPISAVLQEMGVWEKVERAGFPVKIGATYTWGHTVEPWVFEFLPLESVPTAPVRPGSYGGWRVQTAFQVDRAVYDQILLDHARDLGCDVRERTRVASVLRQGDRIDGLALESGEIVRARWYVDASGNAAVLRRAMDVAVEVPTPLKNVAFWNYWENPRWASEPDVSVTRVHIRSIGYGWIWFIRLSASRASVGLVCNAEFYKRSGKPYPDLYREALASENEISGRLEGATCRDRVEATTDWSFVVERTFGENWFLVGECAGFADPILAAGLTLTQTGARELAYTILELERGAPDRAWLLERYDEVQRRRVRQHMRFAEYWYSANGIFEDIREECTRIARDSGLDLSPAHAFQWLAQGGLGDDNPGQAGIGGLDVAGVKQVMQMFTGGRTRWAIDKKNVFRLNLAGATESTVGELREGRIRRVRCYVRDGKKLPLVGLQGELVDVLRQHTDASEVLTELRERFSLGTSPAHADVALKQAMGVLEVMAQEGWITCDARKKRPLLEVSTPAEGELIHHVRLEPPR